MRDGSMAPVRQSETRIATWSDMSATTRMFGTTSATGPDDLLVLRITEGEGWRELCPFLDQEVPEAPFPHVNPFQGAPGCRETFDTGSLEALALTTNRRRFGVRV